MQFWRSYIPVFECIEIGSNLVFVNAEHVQIVTYILFLHVNRMKRSVIFQALNPEILAKNKNKFLHKSKIRFRVSSLHFSEDFSRFWLASRNMLNLMVEQRSQNQ